MNIEKFIQEIPKAELHLHIEGSFQPELMFQIAQRNHINIKYKNIAELRQAYQFSCLQDFLDIYYTGAGVLTTEEDFYDLTMAYFEQCRKEHILLAEIMFDPQTHTQRGIPFSTVIGGIQRAREEAKRKYGIDSLLIMSYLRHLSEDDALETLRQSLPFKQLIHSVGLDSSEKGNPPTKFKKAFEASAKEGYSLVAHAGEEGDAGYVREAIEELKIARIDHGNNLLKDEKLVAEVIKKDIALTVCPLSNLALHVVDDLKKHPLSIMLQKGLKATVNSDDPAYFGGYLTENFLQIQGTLNLTPNDIVSLVKNSFQYSFAGELQRKKYVEKVDEFVTNFEE